MTNDEVIANGGGSPQERSHRCGGDCLICNPKDEENPFDGDFDKVLQDFSKGLDKLADPKENTHLLDLLEQLLKQPGITILKAHYTQEGIMADFRYSLDHKDYRLEISRRP